jgi:hypothetical protein
MKTTLSFPTNIPFAAWRTLVALAIFGTMPVISQSQSPITSGLAGYWSGNGNANDSSVNANNGSFSGTYASGQSGQEAFQVNGANSYVSIPAISAYNFSSAFSVGLWFYGSPANGSVFLGQDNGGGTQNKWFVDYGYFTSGSFDFHENGSTYGFLSSDAASPASATWNNLAVVKDGSLYSFYLNGSGIGSQTLSGTFPQQTAPFTIGYAEPGLGYNGLIDDVALYNRALVRVRSAGTRCNP